MMSPPPTAPFRVQADYYRATFGATVRAVRPAGRTGAKMVLARDGVRDWSSRAHGDLAFAQVNRGRIDRADIDLGAGRFGGSGAALHDYAVVPPTVDTRILVDGDYDLRLLCIPYGALLDLAGGEGALPPDGDFGAVHARIQTDRAIARIIDRIWIEGARGSARGALWADGAILQLAALLSDRTARRDARTGALAGWQVRKVCDYMAAHLADDVDIATLAALVGISPGHFGRAFRVATGRPPYRWLAEQRIDRARTLLADRSLSLTDIAQQVGYSGQGPFTDAFRRIVGVAPGAYRRLL